MFALIHSERLDISVYPYRLTIQALVRLLADLMPEAVNIAEKPMPPRSASSPLGFIFRRIRAM